MKKLLLILITLLLTASAYSKEIILTPENSVNITTAITESSVSKAIKDLIAADNARKSPDSPIYIVLDSPGGSIMAGNKFIRFANTIPNVHTICMYCASMAHAISQGIVGKRYGLTDNVMMAHRAKGGFSGQFENGEVESRLKLFKSIVRSMELRNAKRIGISLSKYKNNVVNEWWTYGQDSIEQGILDALVDIKCSKELIALKSSSTVMTLFGPIKGGEKSACPLI